MEAKNYVRVHALTIVDFTKLYVVWLSFHCWCHAPVVIYRAVFTWLSKRIGFGFGFGFGFTTPFGWLVYLLWFWFYDSQVKTALLDYEQSLFFLGPSSKTRDTQMATRSRKEKRVESHRSTKTATEFHPLSLLVSVKLKPEIISHGDRELIVNIRNVRKNLSVFKYLQRARQANAFDE